MKPPALTATLYLCDNGACYCREHLGFSARTTGRDISGQPIEPIHFADTRAAGFDPDGFACETCGARLAAIAPPTSLAV